MEADALSGFLVPPRGMWARLRYYAARYGLIHAACSYAGRKCPRFWSWIGPIVTRRYLENWLSSPGPHILNLGGGSALSERWLTADITPRSDVFIDVTRPLPLPDDSIDVVYSEEVIEHLDRQTGQHMLRECFRILKPGGMIRITTPSLDYFASHALSPPAAAQDINAIFCEHGHRFIYSKAALNAAIKEAGFRNTLQSSYRDPASRYGVLDSHPARFPFAPPEWSQYWEAEKPNSRPHPARVDS